MIEFKLTCPDCQATIVTHFPQAIVWELCPGCNHHVWDGYDALMAEVCAPSRKYAQARGLHAEN